MTTPRKPVQLSEVTHARLRSEILRYVEWAKEYAPEVELPLLDHNNPNSLPISLECMIVMLLDERERHRRRRRAARRTRRAARHKRATARALAALVPDQPG